MSDAPGTQQSGRARIERREYLRYQFEAPVTIKWGTTVRHARVRMIGAGGMEIELSDPMWVGAGFLAELALDSPIGVLCEVRYVVPGRCMGVSLVVPEKSHRQQFEALLAKLAESNAVDERT
jgi:hypothetical protein